jgi:hypothetical protein
MIISIRANQLRNGDKLVHIEYVYNERITKLTTLPNGNVEITMGRGRRVRTVAPTTECGVSR